MNDTLTVQADAIREGDQIRVQDDWYTVEDTPKSQGVETHMTVSHRGRFNSKLRLVTKAKYTIKSR